MKKTVRVLAVLLSLAMLFSFVGCGKDAKKEKKKSEDEGVMLEFEDETTETGGSTSEKGSSTGTAGENTAAKVEQIKLGSKNVFDNIPKRLKGTTVTIAHWGDEGGSEYEKVLKAFTKKTGIKYKLVSYNQAEYVSQVTKQIAAKSGPDIIISTSTFPSIIEICQPLQGMIDLSEDFWDKDLIDYATVGGNTYLVNSLTGVWQNLDFVYYNKDIFSKNGITTPMEYYKAGKWTYENFKKTCEQLKGFGYIGGYADPLVLSAAMGNPMISMNAKTSTFSSNVNGLAAGYQYYATLVKEGLWDTSEWWGNFPNGKIGMMVTDLYGSKYNGYFKNMNDSSLAIAPMPTSYKGKACKFTTGLRGYGIAKGAKNPEGAAYLLRYFLDYSYYGKAGANVFKNKTLEKFYTDTIIPAVKKQGRIFYFNGDPMRLVGQNDVSHFMDDVEKADPAQVPSILATKANVIQNAVKAANNLVAKYK